MYMGLVDKVVAAISDLHVPVAIPLGKNPAIAPREDATTTVERDASSGWAVWMEYVNAKGEASSRRVICRRIEGYGKAEVINGYCCESKQTKSFRVDRIAELVCLDTGEILDPIEHFETLRLFGSLQVVDKTLTSFVQLLVFVAKCDGHFHPLEVKEIDTAIERYVMRFGGDDRLIEAAKKNSRRLAPDALDFTFHFRAIERHPEVKSLSRLLLDSVGKVVDADARHAPQELTWAVTISDALHTLSE